MPAVAGSAGLRSADGGVTVALGELLALRQEARRLDITPRGRVLATRSGGHLSRFRGRGMEFDESRVYQSGDELRNMDWRVTARTGQPHVKLFREERERPVWLVVDQRAGMHFGTRVAFKSVVAAHAAALLGWAASDQGDRVGGLVFDERQLFRRQPAAGNRGLLPLLGALAGEVPAGGEGGCDAIARAALQAAAAVRSGSLVFVISDFHGLDAEDAAWMARLARAGELVLVQVYDPLEASAPPPGRYPVSDGVHRTLIDTGARDLQEAWRGRFAAATATLETLCQRHRTHLVRLRTDQPVGETLRLGLGSRRKSDGGR